MGEYLDLIKEETENIFLEAKKQKTISSEFKQAMSAHNKGLEVTANDNYNEMKKLGTERARAECRAIANSKTGSATGKISLKNAIDWAKGMLPKGKGYPSQDITPMNEPFVTWLKTL
jgi:septin family protein